MFELAILSFMAVVISRWVTAKYRLANIKLVANGTIAKETLIELVGENAYYYYVGLAAAYESYRKKFTIGSLFIRPSSARENSIVFYLITLGILVWWMVNGLPSLLITFSIILLILSHEYVSYWRDSYYQTVNNEEFKKIVQDLNDKYKPTHRLG